MQIVSQTAEDPCVPLKKFGPTTASFVLPTFWIFSQINENKNYENSLDGMRGIRTKGRGSQRMEGAHGSTELWFDDFATACNSTE